MQIQFDVKDSEHIKNQVSELLNEIETKEYFLKNRIFEKMIESKRFYKRDWLFRKIPRTLSEIEELCRTIDVWLYDEVSDEYHDYRISISLCKRAKILLDYLNIQMISGFDKGRYTIVLSGKHVETIEELESFVKYLNKIYVKSKFSVGS